MNNPLRYASAQWLSPLQAADIVAARLSRVDHAQAIELVLDHASEGRIASKARRIAEASTSGIVVRDDEEIPADVWHGINQGSTYASWETGDFDATIYRSGTGWVTVTVRGVRLLSTDVIAIVPGAVPFSGASSAAPAAPAQPWPEAQMIVAIRECSIANRDAAWIEHFKRSFSDHGWTNEAFRELWSRARGSKGRTGRPARRN